MLVSHGGRLVMCHHKSSLGFRKEGEEACTSVECIRRQKHKARAEMLNRSC